MQDEIGDTDGVKLKLNWCFLILFQHLPSYIVSRYVTLSTQFLSGRRALTCALKTTRIPILSFFIRVHPYFPPNGSHREEKETV